MIYRFLFVGYTNDVKSVKCAGNTDCYVTLSYENNMVFMYVESNEKAVNPEALAEGDFIRYPDGNKWERAIEIFHYSVPIRREQWNRKIQNKNPYITLNRVKPEKAASYIFYHYQYQEEGTGDGDRYGIIYIFRDILIFYHERPTEKETEYIEGALKTNHSPIDRWSEVMNEHFADRWHEIKNIETTNCINF